MGLPQGKLASSGADTYVFFHGPYPIPQEPQLLEAQLPQPDEPADLLTWGAPPGPIDLDTNPQADMSRDRSWLSQEGHWGLKLPITRVSKSFLQALHVYS